MGPRIGQDVKPFKRRVGVITLPCGFLRDAKSSKRILFEKSFNYFVKEMKICGYTRTLAVCNFLLTYNQILPLAG